MHGDEANYTIMVAAGWIDGHWAVSRCYDYVPGRAAAGRDDPVSLVQGDVHWWAPASTAPHHTFRLWLGAAKG